MYDNSSKFASDSTRKFEGMQEIILERLNDHDERLISQDRDLTLLVHELAEARVRIANIENHMNLLVEKLLTNSDDPC